jgi:hypothetical protein
MVMHAEDALRTQEFTEGHLMDTQQRCQLLHYLGGDYATAEMLRWDALQGAEIIASFDVPRMHLAEWQVQRFHELMEAGREVKPMAEECSLTVDAVLNYMRMVRGGKDVKVVPLGDFTILCIGLSVRIIPFYVATNHVGDWLSFLASEDVARWPKLKRQAIQIMLEYGSISVVAEETRPDGRYLAVIGYPSVFFLRYALPATFFSVAIRNASYKVLPLIPEWFDRASLALIGEVAATTMRNFVAIKAQTKDPSGETGWILGLPDKRNQTHEVALQASLFKYPVNTLGVRMQDWPGVWGSTSVLEAFAEHIFIRLAGLPQAMPLPRNHTADVNCVTFDQARNGDMIDTKIVFKSDVVGKTMRFPRMPAGYSV